MKATGREDDLKRVIGSSVELDFDVFGPFTMYDAEFEDETLLAAIRSDYGVNIVECPTMEVHLRH